MSGELTQARRWASVQKKLRTEVGPRNYYRRLHEETVTVSMSMTLTRQESDLLSGHAAALKMTRSGLCRRLVERVLTDNLVRAVIDEEAA